MYPVPSGSFGLMGGQHVPLHPSQDGRMSQHGAPLGHHLDQVAGAEFKGQVPPHAQHDDLLVKMPPLEEILCRGRFRHPGRYGSAPGFSSVCTRTPQEHAISRLKVVALTKCGERSLRALVCVGMVDLYIYL